MSRKNNNEISSRAANADSTQRTPSRAPLSAAPSKRTTEALTHELANLLDGSLRHLGLAITSLREPVHADETSEDLLKRLEAANTAMRHMATLIHRWMASPRSADSLFEQQRTVGQTIDNAVQLLAPAAALRGIDVQVQLTNDAAALPSGPLHPIIVNAVRNSIEAMVWPPDDGDRPRVIEIAARVYDGQLEIRVSDTGTGLDKMLSDASGRFAFGITTKRDGHGVGLQLSRDIAASLGGTLELVNRPAPAHGAVLTLRYPVQSVRMDS